MAGLAIPIVLRIAFCSLMAFKPKSLLTASVAGLLGASMSTVNRVIYVHFKTHTTLNAYQLHYLQEIWLHTPNVVGPPHHHQNVDGAIIGQGGPANSVLASLWANIATKYASNSKIVFGVMNERHDLSRGSTWAATVQGAVTAIVNSRSFPTFLTNIDSVQPLFVSDGSGPALAGVTNPDGSTVNLIFDVHKCLDYDGSGGNTVCVGDQVSTAFAPLIQ
ncbi:uncharacterized protein PAC_05022 [Phialocephala subalpina]|uniref:cellulase n=1 Tax=Phialocephala subalpina TaxID=576137 RepID=A0A1L7WQU2_9HELO|nr:uncharacterized protein PAC_05022 [Phialocephala subalpina]